MTVSRRTVLAAAGSAALAAAVPRSARASSAFPTRLATLDWALLETMLALGLAPVAAAELVLYRRQVIEPALNAGIVDLGLRGAPNYEALLAARPDLILSSTYTSWAEPQLSRLAPIARYVIHAPGRAPLGPAAEAMRDIGARTGRAGDAAAAIAAFERDLAAGAAALRSCGPAARRVVVINFGDARHLRVFGADSVFGEVVARLGLVNAWSEGTRYSATAPVGIEALARMPDAFVLVAPPVPPDAVATLERGALWRALPNVASGQTAILASCNPFGGLPTARRFARSVVTALTGVAAEAWL